MKLRFLPHLEGQLAADADKEERFYTSFALLCTHYGITPSETRPLGYPYNKALALWEARGLLRMRQENIEIIDNDSGTLQALETYNTGNILYYIPVVPLYRLLHHRRTKPAAGLLLCTCAYLYHVAGIPYYTDDSSYLSWQYDMIRQWVEDDPEGWEDESYACNRSQLNTTDHIGAVMQRRLWNPCHLNRFGQLVEQFIPLDNFGCECLAIAQKALSLWKDYPQGNVYRHADRSAISDDGYDDDEGCITMDKYIGFCAETEGWLYHTLSECVNSEFNECPDIQQPVLTRTFDGRAQEDDSLDFDCRLFALIDDLCFTLNNNANENAA
ncbi:hypothetical protein [uncultured Flavobacterium sp.]|uniref:hypothetical protein n=1 Tax=uncultured Flavobacterium sp. TaxID=165435 RepID=UPI0025F80EEF|nr:hypothetical protein [uncultured Flavobacterium sp.]